MLSDFALKHSLLYKRSGLAPNSRPRDVNISALRPRSLIKTHNSPFDLIFAEFLWRNKFGSWRRM